MGVEPSSRPDSKPLLVSVRIKGFRNLKDAGFRPGPLSALVGEPGAGKSNLLAGIRAVLDPDAPPLRSQDVSREGMPAVSIEIETRGGRRAMLSGEPPATSLSHTGDEPPLLYMPADLRSGSLIARSQERRDLPDVTGLLASQRETAGPSGEPGQRGSAAAARDLVGAVESWVASGVTGVVILIEEPELFLPPQGQRYLYRLLRDLSRNGNQIIYSTHSPFFLNVARLDELVLTSHDPVSGTRLVQPEPLPAEEEFRAYSEFDAARSELFLARAAVLVEGQTERLALPFVFRALGFDADREGSSIVECGGKPNIPLIARVARSVGVPFLAVHDRDAPAGKRPNQAELTLNRMIAEIAGDRRVELAPDFEGIAGLRGRSRKPARAWRRFATLTAGEVPEPLARIVREAVALTSSTSLG